MMNILFISYTAVSLCKGSVRAAAMLRALADAGHRVDLVAPYADLPDHPHIRVLAGSGGVPLCRIKLRMVGLRAAGRGSYDAIHAVDESVFFAMRLCRWKKVPLVYDASRCFSGKVGSGTSSLWRFFPKHLQRLEAKVLERADIVFSPCSVLTADLYGMGQASVVQLEDIPAQPLYARQDADRSILPGLAGKRPVLSSSKGPVLSSSKRPGPVVVCSALPGHSVGFRKLLMATRKVVDAVPGAVFFFKGAPHGQAEKMAANLDIADHCVFLSPNDPETFLSALAIADVVLMVPHGESRYIHPQVYTLLHAGAPLVTIHHAAYDEILTEKTSVHLLPNSESIAEGLLRVIQEPLFSLAVSLEGQQLVAARHTYSSFKHKVRMTYHQLANTQLI